MEVRVAALEGDVQNLSQEVASLRPKHLDLGTKIALTSLVLTVGGILVGSLIWLVGNIHAKADATSIREVEAKIEGITLKQAIYDKDIEWVKSTLYQVARQQGVSVSPPPTSPRQDRSP
jgi:hypothetical protein